MVDAPFVAAENRLKTLCIKVTIIDFVASLHQSIHDRSMECRLKASLNWMCINYEKLHRPARPILAKM